MKKPPIKPIMTRIARYLSLVFLGGLLSLSQSAFAQEQKLDVTPSFFKCGSLLGKSTHAALVAFGPPTATWKAPYTVYDPGGHFLRWEYTGKDGRRLELIFLDKVLLLADITRSRIDIHEDLEGMSNLAPVFSSCKPSSLKMIYFEATAKRAADTNGRYFGCLLRGTTQDGHMVSATCLTPEFSSDPILNSPLIVKQVLNESTGLNENKYIPNPNFSISDLSTIRIILSEGKGALYERYHLTKAEEQSEQKAQFGGGLLGYMMSMFGRGSSEPVVIVPVTPTNSPWLFQPKATGL